MAVVERPDGAAVSGMFSHPLAIRDLTRDEADWLGKDLTNWMVEQPDRYPYEPRANQSPGGDPRLMKGGELRPNHRSPRRKKRAPA